MGEDGTTDAATPGTDADDSTTRDRAIERALACVNGVASASISRAPGNGAGRLRLRLRPGQDHLSVADAVAATLEERFQVTVDPATIRVVGAPVPPPAGGAPPPPMPRLPAPLVARRASITHLDIAHHERQVHVTIGLSRDDHRAEGTARTPSGAQDLLRTVAEATARALQQLAVLPFVLEVLEVEHAPDEDPPRMLVAVRLASHRGDEHLLGAAVVRDDPEAAVVRATLDAVNRRVEPLLTGEPDPQTDEPA